VKERVYAEATLDLLEFALQPGRTVKRTLPLAQGKKTLPTHLVFSIKATPLREGVALSEVSSDMSVADLADVQDHPDIAPRATGGEEDLTSAAAFQSASMQQQQQQTTETEVVEEDVIEEVEVGMLEQEDNFETFDEEEEIDDEEIATTAEKRRGQLTMEEGMRALAAALEPEQPLRANPPQPKVEPRQGRYIPQALGAAGGYDQGMSEQYGGYTVGMNAAQDVMVGRCRLTLL